MTPEVFQAIRRIHILSKQLAQDIFAGSYRSVFKGKGMEFEEVREYASGDDTRHIDWNVTARMRHPFVKTFREERELTVMLVVDVSSSLNFGSTNRTKAELTAELAAVLAFSAIKNQDKVGLILFTDTVEQYIPPRKGTGHVLRVIRDLLAFKPKRALQTREVNQFLQAKTNAACSPVSFGSKSNISSALTYLGKIQKHSGICFLISDFMCPDYSHEAKLVAKRHDLIAVSMTDPHENDFPNLSNVGLRDFETAHRAFLNTSKGHQRFIHLAEQRILGTSTLMKSIKADFIDIRTNESYIEALKKFFRMRESRR